MKIVKHDAGAQQIRFIGDVDTVRRLIAVGLVEAQELVLRRADHARHLNVGKVVHSAADKLVIPARLAFEVEDVRLPLLHVDHAGQAVVVDIVFARDRLNADIQSFGARLAAAEYQRLGLHLAVGFQRDVLRREHLAAIAHREAGFASREAIALERDHSREFRVGQSARRSKGVDDFHVAIGMLASEPDGVDGNALPADGVDRVQIDPARVIRPVAQQHHGAQRQRG